MNCVQDKINSISSKKCTAFFKRWMLRLCLFLIPVVASADGTYLTDMRVELAPASLAYFTDPTRNTTGAIPGDIIEFIMSARVANAEAGPSTYMTAYVSEGVEILGAWFVTDETGSTPREPGPGGHGHDGWGLRGNVSPFGNPFSNTGTGRQNDLFGDTGIFFSSDPRTAVRTESSDNIVIGPTAGRPDNTGAFSNGFNVNNTFFGEIDAFNLWDADQVNAFGTGGPLNSIPGNSSPTSSAVVINSAGKGATPFNSGSPVAGPHSGYQLDNTGSIGPWQRIQYPGSEVADISDGPANSIGNPDSPDQLNASSMGVPLNSAGNGIDDSTGLPGNVNSVRWSDGLRYENETIYVKIRVRLTSTTLESASGVISNFEANGSDNWASGSKDNPWRYFGPSAPTYRPADLFIGKTLKAYNGINYKGGPVPAGADLQFVINYLNQNFIPVQINPLTDILPLTIATNDCSSANPSLSIQSSDVAVTVSSGTLSCPDPGATVTFSNLPSVTNGRLGGLRGGQINYTIKLAENVALGTSFSNKATFSATLIHTGESVSATAVVNANVGEPYSPVKIDKSVIDLNGGDVVPGDILRYTVSINNDLNSSVSNLTLTDDLPNLVHSFSLVTTPLGATTTFDAAPSGNNGNGLLTVSNISVAAGGNEIVAFDVAVVGSAGIGATINNTANLNYPVGTNQSASVSAVVNESLAYASGIKPLYLYDTNELSRTPLSNNSDKIRINKNGNTQQWVLQPATTGELSFTAGSIPVYLWLKGRKKSEDFSVTVELSSVGSTNTTIGLAATQIVSLDNKKPALFLFNIELPNNTTLQPASQVVLSVTNNHDEDMELFPRVGTHSRVEPELSTVIHVNSVQARDAAYPAGNIKSAWLAGESVYIQSHVTDPFGSFDIAGATIKISNPSGSVVVGPTALNEIANDSGSKTYEFQYDIPSDAPVGIWDVEIVAAEGTENTVTHTAKTEFTVTELHISGYVFNDTNVNGTLEAQESGIAPVVVILQNNATQQCASTQTDANGYYQFAALEPAEYAVYESANTAHPVPSTCTVTTSSATGYLSLLGHTNTVNLSTNPIDDVNFPNVRNPEFTIDGNANTIPGNFVLLPHTFKPFADGTVDFSITQSSATPSTPAWTHALFQDVNCNQSLEQEDTVFNSAFTVQAEVDLCLLVKVFAPGNANANTQYQHTLRATYQFADPESLGHGLNRIIERNDSVVSGGADSGLLVLDKVVQNLSTNGLKGKNNTALPDQVMRYTISYTNTGVSTLTDLAVHDYIPAYTKLDKPVVCPSVLPQSLTACTIVVPQPDANVQGYNGLIEWNFLGSLVSGESGEVEFDVLID